MNKTLRIAFSLKNTYVVNSILYGIRQMPILKKILPVSLYQAQELKAFANVLTVLWELMTAFAGKLLFFLVAVFLPLSFYENISSETVFLNIYVMLTIVGAYGNTYVFNPKREKYYAIVLMRMDAKQYTLVHYAYFLIKMFIGYAIFGVIFGRMAGLSILECILLPLSVVGIKSFMIAVYIRNYKKTGKVANENKGSKLYWITMVVLMFVAYGLPYFGYVMPRIASVVALVIFTLAGITSIKTVVSFEDYYVVQKQILTEMLLMVEMSHDAVQNKQRNMIAVSEGGDSKKKGFEYLNELFIKRHHKLLWKASLRMSAIAFVVFAGLITFFARVPSEKQEFLEVFSKYLPYFAFIMYSVNRGGGFTSALFVNCDHCLLTYSFYKQPKHILKLFRLRLWEIIKINLLPAVVIATGIVSLLAFCGETEVINYVIAFTTIIALSIFFSVHYLTIYYLLQPYNAGTEIKSGSYQFITWITYMISFIFIYVRIDIKIFGIGAIAFCVLYCIIASILVYRLAPKTFRIR